MKRRITILFFMMLAALSLTLSAARAASSAALARAPGGRVVVTVDLQDPNCPVVIPQPPIAVAPGQPEIEEQSTVGIINALCDVTLNLVRCGFIPTSITIGCDSNGDGAPDVSIPLRNITAVNSLLVRATLPSLGPQLPGTAFPLSCCGGIAQLTLTRTLGSGDDNIFGPFTQTIVCEIDLGLRAPVVISASPSDGNCSVAQNILIPGSCFLLADDEPNVTSVFAVERGNPANVIQASKFVILNHNLIDALFNFGSSSASKTFLIFATGPNGTSRNLTSLPEGAPTGCPLGNEQGIQVTFTCRSNGAADPPLTPAPRLLGCKLERSPSGVFSLTIDTDGMPEDALITVGGVKPKKVKYKEPTFEGSTYFKRAVLKGKFCKGLPGEIKITVPGIGDLQPMMCAERCGS
jgi:hypothetical protein